MKDRRLSRTENAIRNAFFELLNTYPADKINVKKLCEEANINRSTFYDHHEDYYAFLRSLGDSLVERYMTIFDLYHFDTRTDEMMDIQFKAVRNNKNLFSLLFRSDFAAVREQCIQKEKELVIPKWLECSDVSKEDAEIIFTYMIHGILSVWKLWIDSNFTIEEERIKGILENVGKYGIYYYIYTK